MSFNQLMHPRNIYRVKPNYLQLGEKYPSFKELLTFYKNGKAKLNFTDPQALRLLTITLLDNDFSLKVDLPIDRLIPAVPQRLNYVLWVEDLLSLLDLNPNENVNGIDIGTGACCIFPLLGCTTNKSWTFIATEADEVSYKFAVENILTNQLSHRIKVIKVTPEIFLLHLPGIPQLEAHFLMCNPPFFNDRTHDDCSLGSESGDEELGSDEGSSKSLRKRKPSPANLSSPLESVTSGGEVDFVKKIIEDSLILKESIKIYTVMLGHKKSSSILSQHLKNISDVKDVVVNQFFQGRTMRWGLAWTFLENLKLSESIKITETRRLNKKKIAPLTYTIPKNLTTINYSLSSIYRWIRHLLRDELEITTVDIIRESNHSVEMTIRSQRDTWSHQRRRKRMLAKETKTVKNEENQKWT
ncbi:U6 small nuclear RNA (adenine-(43)-N(6))-methyltransferase [Tetranychus urticae]|uniref:U6 small nuclear RNA (adenine-(43)-N(6))-methyltransferase n=1 Tax=Tetranychus urticae TaxID=32264 RepID=UPI00077BB08D|nr:U6 small nuclear RNA (adenine-(43)-N(6))-methyltransferase [Tetranychus urticae]